MTPPGLARKIASRAVLILGLTLMALYAARWLPREQTLAFELPQKPAGPYRVSVSWRRNGEREALGGASWTLQDPPKRLVHKLTLPDGDYVVLVELTPLGTKGIETSWERRVTLRAGETVLVLAPDGS